MYVIDAKSSEKYFLILKDDKLFCKIAKSVNTLDAVKNYFQTEEVMI